MSSVHKEESPTHDDDEFFRSTVRTHITHTHTHNTHIHKPTQREGEVIGTCSEGKYYQFNMMDLFNLYQYRFLFNEHNRLDGILRKDINGIYQVEKGKVPVLIRTDGHKDETLKFEYEDYICKENERFLVEWSEFTSIK
jgi:hypothetical protein